MDYKNIDIGFLRFSIKLRQDIFNDKHLEELFDEEKKQEFKAEIKRMEYELLKYYEMKLADNVDSGVINGDDLR